MPSIAALCLDHLGMSSLRGGSMRVARKVSTGTINHGLKIVRRVPNLAATEWTDEYGMTWLAQLPKNRLLPDKDKRQPDPLSWDEQSRLFSEFPVHLGEMALFAVNTGCRDAEACGLQWDWECAVPELGTITFIIPGWYVKDGDERLVPAQSRDTQPDSSNRHHAISTAARRRVPASRLRFSCVVVPAVLPVIETALALRRAVVLRPVDEHVGDVLAEFHTRGVVHRIVNSSPDPRVACLFAEGANERRPSRVRK